MIGSTSGKHLTAHEAVCDAVLRNTQGLDDDDIDLMTSAFTENATQDMTAFKFLAPFFGVVEGRDAIVGMASGTVGKMDTTHMTSNFRTQIAEDGRSAHLTCYALAQHWRPGHGRSFALGSNFLMGNRYEGDLIFDGNLWRFTRLAIKPQWTQGDFGVFDMETWSRVEQAVKKGR